MTDVELFEALVSDARILFYHDKLAMIDWRITVSITKRTAEVVQGKLSRREPKHIVSLKKYLREEYSIQTN